MLKQQTLPKQTRKNDISKDKEMWINVSSRSHNFFGCKAHSHRTKHNAKMVTNCLWTPAGYQEQRKNQAEIVACSTFRTVSKDNFYFSHFLYFLPLKKILCWLHLPFSNNHQFVLCFYKSVSVLFVVFFVFVESTYK